LKVCSFSTNIDSSTAGSLETSLKSFQSLTSLSWHETKFDVVASLPQFPLLTHLAVAPGSPKELRDLASFLPKSSLQTLEVTILPDAKWNFEALLTAVPLSLFLQSLKVIKNDATSVSVSCGVLTKALHHLSTLEMNFPIHFTKDTKNEQKRTEGRQVDSSNNFVEGLCTSPTIQWLNLRITDADAASCKCFTLLFSSLLVFLVIYPLAPLLSLMLQSMFSALVLVSAPSRFRCLSSTALLGPRLFLCSHVCRFFT
jgi:hypothetical protein